ncbi:MAG TPA: glycoside hydrolase, partial [Blastocatellia bacterium]|nr:glycoside hydrolase [Blastocatellia bacterium]
MNRAHCFLLAAVLLLAAPATGAVMAQDGAQQNAPEAAQGLRWRMIGPFRGGRTVGATGVPSQPNVFYIGVNNGGVWKTDDFGRTWNPIFDDQPTGSIGTVAVAPSDPNIVYVGSGEGLQRPDLSTGDGMFKSTDAGKTWRHLDLADAQQIGAILIDPADPNRLFVAVLGHPYGANEQRGVFRSTDGGDTWQRVLYKDENTGAIALAFDPSNSRTVYADLWAARQAPWENGEWQGPGSGLYKSTDGGETWRQLAGGLPTPAQGLGRIGFTVAPNDPSRMYALVDATKGGLYRSDDAGENWRLVNGEQRIWGRGSDFAEVKVDPKNENTLFIANTSTYKSTDAGATFDGFRGAPGGDDYHTFWINPNNPDIILLVADQGAVVTVNGGRTWSSWYNQPTAQFYHVVTDNRFPYWVYGGQQESGSVGTSSRGNDGEITFRDWRPVGAEEYGYIAPDPLNPNIIYGGKVTRFNMITGQDQNIAPEALRSGKYRFLRTAPLMFSPVDPHVLYFAGNVLFKTSTGGHSWQIISTDLSREHTDVPASIGVYRNDTMNKMARRGVIYALGPSPKDINVIWAGTDDGLVHVTHDGGAHWTNVTPPDLTSWSKVAQIDAGHFDLGTAYIAVNRMRLDDMRPHIYRTHNGGKTWTQIVNGLPDNAPVDTVREDPERKGLLFCGTERAVFVSFDDGDHWQSLRLNMPATAIRDLVIHNDDVVVGTHGRSFWILDDITPLRQTGAQVTGSNAYLFKPATAIRAKRDTNTDTPLPPDEPAGQNPPDGAIIDYYLKSAPTGPVVLEILDRTGQVVRRFSSNDKPEVIDPKALSVPMYWIRRPRVLSGEAGMHRWVWDLHYPRPEWIPGSPPISAIRHDTPLEPEGPAIAPGQYTVKLTVDGKTLTQPLTVKLDPRVTIPPISIA